MSKFVSILFQQKTFNNRICMSTHNQLHYYATISMKVTIFSAVRQTLPCFHQTFWREKIFKFCSFVTILPFALMKLFVYNSEGYLNRDISPNFPRNFDYRTRDHMYFLLKHIVTILPFQIYVNSATYETFCVQLRGRTTVHVICTVYVCHSDS